MKSTSKCLLESCAKNVDVTSLSQSFEMTRGMQHHVATFFFFFLVAERTCSCMDKLRTSRQEEKKTTHTRVLSITTRKIAKTKYKK